MPWFRLDDGFHNHPKVARAGNAAVGLWVRCATYSAHYLTDGRIPNQVVRKYGSAFQERSLNDAGLWIPTDQGFIIPDYLEYNPSAEQVQEERKKARARQQRSRMQSRRDSE